MSQIPEQAGLAAPALATAPKAGLIDFIERRLGRAFGVFLAADTVKKTALIHTMPDPVMPSP